MNDAMLSLLAKLTTKDLLVNNLQDALDRFKELPIDENFQRLSMCAVLVAMKEAADNSESVTLIEEMVANTIPFFMASAN